ncbi:MAG: CsbD family protein [Bryobacteraceae bacterium]
MHRPLVRMALHVPHLRVLPENRKQDDKNMNWDQFAGKWKRFTGSARERWGKITNNNRQTFTGKKDQLAGRIQEQYGAIKAKADQRADDRALAQKGSESDAATRL